MKKLLFVLVLLLTFASYGQKKPEKELGIWYMYNGSHKLSEKFGLKTMAHFRFFDQANDFQQLLTRLGVNYKINKTLNATLGYSYVNTDTSFDTNGGEISEHRVYGDLNIKHHISELSLAHRLRAEQRFYNSKTGNFFRYQLAFNHPINNKWSAYLYDEVFFDLDGKAFNQNWLGTGIKYKLSNAVKLQLGYMVIHNDVNKSFNRIQLGVAISNNHFKKK